jgi:hypothetical protein
LRQPADLVRHRPAELVQGRIGEVDLTLDADRANHLEPGRRCDQLLEERRLADARLAPHDESGAPTGSHGREQPLEQLALGISADERAQP